MSAQLTLSPANAAYISTANPLPASATYISTANPSPASAAYISTANPSPASAAYISTNTNNIALRRFLHNHGNIATVENPKPGLCPTLISNDFKGSL